MPSENVLTQNGLRALRRLPNQRAVSYISNGNMLRSVTPFFIVDDLNATIDFYQSKLGFQLLHKGGSDGTDEDYWAMVGRDQVMLFFKAIAPDIHPRPNSSRHGWAAWDAYVYTDDPDALYREFVDRGVPMHRELANNSDNLRAFEVADNNGYVLCFGRPIEPGSLL